jgi:hypothetical protein
MEKRKGGVTCPPASRATLCNEPASKTVINNTPRRTYLHKTSHLKCRAGWQHSATAFMPGSARPRLTNAAAIDSVLVQNSSFPANCQFWAWSSSECKPGTLDGELGVCSTSVVDLVPCEAGLRDHNVGFESPLLSHARGSGRFIHPRTIAVGTHRASSTLAKNIRAHQT